MSAKRKASELLSAPNTSCAMVRAMVKLGRVQDGCGLLDELDELDDLPEQRPTPKQPAAVIQLPVWPGQTRGTPNSFLRGALFAAIQGKDRRALKREVLASQKGTSTGFTGWQLDQSDLDVWKQAAQLAASHPSGNVCHFHISAFPLLGYP
jgi:hypothetical protein